MATERALTMYGQASGVIWYRTPEGTLVEQSGIPAPEVPEGCTPINPSDYYRAMEEAEAAEAAAVEADRQAAAERQAMIDEAVAFYLAAQQTEPPAVP